jgi:hypothetical protein
MKDILNSKYFPFSFLWNYSKYIDDIESTIINGLSTGAFLAIIIIFDTLIRNL